MSDTTELHPSYELRNFMMLPKTTEPEFLTLIAHWLGVPWTQFPWL